MMPDRGRETSEALYTLSRIADLTGAGAARCYSIGQLGDMIVARIELQQARLAVRQPASSRFLARRWLKHLAWLAGREIAASRCPAGHPAGSLNGCDGCAQARADTELIAAVAAREPV